MSEQFILPVGIPVGSFGTYAGAQAAVDALSDEQFPVEDLTIVGTDLKQVEKIYGRLTWGRVIATGAASGAWFGLFIGLLLGIFAVAGYFQLIAASVIIGIIFGIIAAAISYALTGGKRDFTSESQIVATRYEILCKQGTADKARTRLAQIIK